MKIKIEHIVTSYINDENLQHIDVYFEGQEEGKTVCVLCLDSRKLIWRDMNYRFNEQVKDAITKMLNDQPLKPRFPNGFTSWQETHYEIVNAISGEMRKNDPTEIVLKRHEAQGTGGLYELAEELTQEFENIHYGCEWGIEIEFFDEIENFIDHKLYNSKKEYQSSYQKK